MNTTCEVIREVLPLYADNACSAGSRGMVEAHLRKCPRCRGLLKRMDAGASGDGVKAERALVVRRGEAYPRQRSVAFAGLVAALFAVSLLTCLVVNLCTGRTLDWFYIVLAAMIVAASVTVVPLAVPEDKLFWSFLAFYFSLTTLLAVCCLYARGRWFFGAASAAQFGLAAVSLPFVLRAKPMRRWVAGRNPALLVVAVDLILFTNMMNMLTLRGKSFLQTVGLAILCVGALGALVGRSLELGGLCAK